MAAVGSAAWRKLEALAQRPPIDVGVAFTKDPNRFERLSREAAGVKLDLSHQRLDEEILEVLLGLPDTVKARAAIEAMWKGEHVNVTEDRAVLHVALRQAPGDAVGGAAIEAAVLAERERMLRFAEEIRSSNVDTVINIGIGGSDLGPLMACEALVDRGRRVGGSPLKVRFVSNVDGCALADLLREVEPARCLFIVCSKTFTTPETMTNAQAARAWIEKHLGLAAVPKHFAAVSVNAPAMDAFGIDPARRFAMWDWVGGRYSVWSAIGLSLAILIGAEGFKEFLAGAREMDRHYREAPWRDNLPALAALAGVWNINFANLPTLAVLPYTDRLKRFPAFLQQLEMESNGKSVTREGAPVACGTAPVIWGEPGNNGQHSFFQMLHQGTLRAALDVILVAEAPCPGTEAAHALGNANALAQIEAFTVGAQTSDPHRVHVGSRPLSTLVIPRLSPGLLGALIALYEHKVHLQGLIWGVNSYDQFGVELGKRLVGQGVGGSVGHRTTGGIMRWLKP